MTDASRARRRAWAAGIVTALLLSIAASAARVDSRGGRNRRLVPLAGVVLAGLATLGMVACTHSQVLAPVPPEIRGQIHRIGILAPPLPQWRYAEPPAQGAGWGYLRGVGVCFGGALSSGGGQGAPFVLALAIVGCPTVGGLVGAVQNPSVAEVTEARATLEPIGSAADIGEALRGNLVALLARDAPQYGVRLLTPDEADQLPLGLPVDTVLALENLRVELLQCDTASHVTPPLTLYTVVDAELLRAANRAPLHRERFEYWGETFTFAEWGAAGGDRLALGLARAERSLAEQLVQTFFVAQAPTEMTWPRCVNQGWLGGKMTVPCATGSAGMPISGAESPEMVGQETRDAIALLREGKVVEAEAALDKQLVARPGDVDVKVWKALALLEQARVMKEASESGDKYKPLVYQAYEILQPLGRTQAANPDWHFAMAKAFWLNDRPFRAASHANTALDLRANFAEPHLLRGDIAYDGPLWGGATAQEEYDKALSVPDSPAALQAEALYKLGKVAADLDKKPDSAREYWERAVVADPTSRYGIMAQERLKAAPAK